MDATGVEDDVVHSSHLGVVVVLLVGATGVEEVAFFQSHQ